MYTKVYAALARNTTGLTHVNNFWKNKVDMGVVDSLRGINKDNMILTRKYISLPKPQF